MDKLLIRKDVYDDFIEKGYGKRDYSKLTKKVITDKNGHKRTVFVKNDVTQTSQEQAKVPEITDNKKARYEEMLEKVKRGPEENALFVRGEMLNKKDAISYLELKLGRRNGVVAEQKMKMEDEKKNAAMRDSQMRKKPTVEDYKENYLDAKNEAGKDIAENNKINKVSDLIEFSSDEMKAIQDAANKIGYKPGEEGKLLNAIEDKNIYSSLTKKNSEAWKRSGKEQKTFSSTDLLKEKIKSMNGDFGADTEKVSLKDKVKEWEDKGLPKDAAYAKVAFDDLYDGYENKFDEEKEEINEAFRDIQKNGLKAKYFKDHAKEYGLSSDENKTENPDKIKAKEEYMNEVSDWQKKGLPRDAAFAKVALDRIVKEIKKTPKDDVQKLDELDDMFRDVQLNNTRSKYIQNILNLE